MVGYTRNSWISAAQERHADEEGNPKYDYSEVVYKGSKTKVKIICPIEGHGEFTKLPPNHLQGQGCPVCGSAAGNKAKSAGTEAFIKKARAIHGDKYNYDEVEYVNCKTEVKIRCPKHGLFHQKPTQHISYKHGCKSCGHESMKEAIKSNKEEFIEKAVGVHGNKYDYGGAEYVNSVTPVIIRCLVNPQHGIFMQPPRNHISGDGCRKCGFERTAASNRRSVEAFIMDSLVLHGDKCWYTKVQYKGIKYNVTLLCRQVPEHGAFEMTPASHLFGAGCPKCSHNGYSKISMEWLKYLSQSMGAIQHAENGGEYRIPETRYSVDGYSKETNTVFEFHGDYWHGNPKIYDPDDVNTSAGVTYGELYDKTMLKKSVLEEMGYNYVEIWESDWILLKASL